MGVPGGSCRLAAASRILRLALTSLCACLLLAMLGAAQARARVTLVGHTPGSNALLQRWADQVHAPTPNITVSLGTGFCPYVEGRTCVAVDRKRLSMPDLGNANVRWEIWMPEIGGEYGPPSEWWHLDFLQELGHVYDFAGRHSHSYRATFDRMFDYEQGFLAWIGASNPWQALNDIQEKFAMYYAYCGDGLSFRQQQRSTFWGFGVTPDAREYAQACHLIANLPPEPSATAAGGP
jgi:hypothetical protein